MLRTRIFVLAGAGITGLVTVFVLSVGYHRDYEPLSVTVAEDFQTQVLAAEAALPLRRGTGKSFHWKYADQRRTDFALIQLHGLSATRREVSPVAETLSNELDMNLFMTRLCGHGLGPEGMGSVTAECLLQDTEEAFSIGRRMGDKVVLLGTSTGAALALHLARRYPNDVSALILLSPNVRPASPLSLMLKGPVGGWIAMNLVRTHQWSPRSAEEEFYWTTRYPAIALHEMMNLLSWTNRFDLSAFRMPLLMFYTEKDEVLSVDHMKSAFAAYGGPKEAVEVPDAPHVLAGDIMHPAGTRLVVEKVKSFLSGTL